MITSRFNGPLAKVYVGQACCAAPRWEQPDIFAIMNFGRMLRKKTALPNNYARDLMKNILPFERQDVGSLKLY